MTIKESDLDRYWVVDRELMPASLPPDLNTYGTVELHGEVTFDFEITISPNGRPGDIEVISIKPSVVDVRPFSDFQLFLRYSPGKENADRQAVRVRRSLKMWVPK